MTTSTEWLVLYFNLSKKKLKTGSSSSKKRAITLKPNYKFISFAFTKQKMK